MEYGILIYAAYLLLRHLIGAYITRPRCDPSKSNLSHRLLTSWRKNVWALGRSNSDNYDATFNADH